MGVGGWVLQRERERGGGGGGELQVKFLVVVVSWVYGLKVFPGISEDGLCSKMYTSVVLVRLTTRLLILPISFVLKHYCLAISITFICKTIPPASRSKRI